MKELHVPVQPSNKCFITSQVDAYVINADLHLFIYPTLVSKSYFTFTSILCYFITFTSLLFRQNCFTFAALHLFGRCSYQLHSRLEFYITTDHILMKHFYTLLKINLSGSKLFLACVLQTKKLYLFHEFFLHLCRLIPGADASMLKKHFALAAARVGASLTIPYAVQWFPT